MTISASRSPSSIELALLSRAGHDEAVSLTGEASRRVQGLARSVHDLSHRLHPTRLRLLGLVPALEALRDEFSTCGIEVAFTHENIPSTLRADVTLCVFRIVQEALQNALKHSGAHQVLVLERPNRPALAEDPRRRPGV